MRKAFERLGPTYIKLGQILSSGEGVFPPELVNEFRLLRDRVPAERFEVVRQVVEADLGRPLEAVFEHFETTPIAAASIAQVHAAQLKDGREVIVKVLRPGMRTRIALDLEVMYLIAGMAQRWWVGSRRLKPVEIVREYEKTILDELDLLREAANASQLKRNFAGSNLLYVPEIYWDHCRTDVLVMERIRGVPIGELERLREAGTDFRRLAENGVEIFFTQVFRHNFFHADMHPGNIFVLIDDPAQPRYAAVDFGIVGTLDLRDQRYLAENFLAVFDRDYRRVATLHVQSGWVPPDTRVDEMESAIRTICEPIFDRPLKEIYFGAVLLRLFEALRRFDGQIQPQLLLLQKTLLNVEGLGRQLYPELDIWQTASPVLRRWMRERMSPRNVLRELRRGLPDALEIFKSAPPLAKRALEQLQDGTLRLKVDTSEIERLRAELMTQSRRGDRIIVGAALGLGALLWYGLRLRPVWVGVPLAVGAALIWLLAWLRSDHTGIPRARL
jgi:ubiquinone biosynthesis protein